MPRYGDDNRIAREYGRMHGRGGRDETYDYDGDGLTARGYRAGRDERYETYPEDEAEDRDRLRRRKRNRRPDQNFDYVRRSRSGLPVFDKTLQTTHIWLNEICDELGPDKHHAWKVLSVVLHTLRDRLQLGVAAHLGAQLPLLIRGVYYDQFTPGRLPTDCGRAEFIEDVAEWLADARPTDPVDAIEAVFRVLSRHVPTGEIAKVQDSLPKDLRALWYDAEEMVVPPPEMRRGRAAWRQ